ncbi:siderophore-interacting protein [Goodfellowiella coeruleoviolacea]|uniref:NADPH-dependent ferric siderophore reductase, contains FAD-binding and SIP domains n=1 Tax=Goodfellowiella coeruleoviolacea TaxID=334858 RepID=A0AAE3GA82_9PSEU|nr:siderophore-interacting protein [Goodfellowiella coeruleoviolacea]MCP2163259.1 NADPH-dependent ferric siderophore reductase, contains FAD-binding and SIP domains [Goodfellowiella coeruleoviolacea]
MTSPPTAKAEPSVRPYRVFPVTVRGAVLVTPRMRRITLAGAELAGATSSGLDQRIKVLLPQDGQREPVIGGDGDWYQHHQRLPEEVRPVMRTYTVRRFRPWDNELDVDFVLHGDTGPASRWAARAVVGDRLAVVAPDAQHTPIIGYEYRPPRTSEWSLIAGDETALPAIGAIVESLGPHDRAEVFVEVADQTEVQPLVSVADVRFTWICRDGARPGQPRGLLPAVRAAALPDRPGYAWLAGEAGMIARLRRHLVGERGFDRGSVYFSGYWKSEDHRA